MQPPRGAPPRSSPPLCTAPASPGVGRGDVERGRAGETGRGAPRSPGARHSQELCGGAAGVGARGGVHVRHEGVGERPLSRPALAGVARRKPTRNQASERRGPEQGGVINPVGSFSDCFTVSAGLGAKGRSASSPPSSRWGACFLMPGGGVAPRLALSSLWRRAAFEESLAACSCLLLICREPNLRLKLSTLTLLGFEALSPLTWENFARWTFK